LACTPSDDQLSRLHRRRASTFPYVAAASPLASWLGQGRDEFARLDKEGLTMAEIGQQLGTSAASVCRMLKAYWIQTLQAIA
jgi:hypothetical protein